jgi:hypothetical protein
MMSLSTLVSSFVFGLFIAVLLGCGGGDDGFSGASSSQAFAGPLQRSQTNPRYFTDESGKIVYLTGSHTWNNLQDNAIPSLGAGTFDWTGYLDFLQQKGHNFIRLWVVSHATDTTTGVSASLHFHQRTGPGTALDGQPKFDLTKYDQAYFDRLRQRVMEAGTRGIYVSIMLFDAFTDPLVWKGNPYHVSNNINGINGNPSGDGLGFEFESLLVSQVVALQKAYIHKVIDTVNDLDNVLYEIDNEGTCNDPNSALCSIAWQNELINDIHTYEASKPKQHPVGMTTPVGSGVDHSTFIAALLQSPADWVSLGGSLYFDDIPATDGKKVSLLDTDHIWGVGGDDIWVWKSFVRGHNPIYMDPLPSGDSNPSPPSWWTNTVAQRNQSRLAMGQTLRYANKINLAAMTPRADLCPTSGYCLANQGQEYLVFMGGGGPVTQLNLSGGASSFSVEWLDVRTDTTHTGSPVSAGSSQTVTPPFSGPAVLYLSSGSSKTSTAQPTAGAEGAMNLRREHDQEDRNSINRENTMIPSLVGL